MQKFVKGFRRKNLTHLRQLKVLQCRTGNRQEVDELHFMKFSSNLKEHARGWVDESLLKAARTCPGKEEEKNTNL